MSNNNSAPSLRKRVGEFLILAIYLAIDVYDVWPKSHLWALLAAFAGILALLLLDGGISVRHIWFVSAVTVVICVVIYFAAPLETDPDRPLSSVTDMGFQNGPMLQAGPLNISWRVTNGGNREARADEVKLMPTLITDNEGKPLPTKVDLAERPVWGKLTYTGKGDVFLPHVPFLLITVTDMSLTPEQVSGINKTSIRLFIYGAISYDTKCNYGFIASYRPDLHQFVIVNEDYPTYSQNTCN